MAIIAIIMGAIIFSTGVVVGILSGTIIHKCTTCEPCPDVTCEYVLDSKGDIHPAYSINWEVKRKNEK